MCSINLECCLDLATTFMNAAQSSITLLLKHAHAAVDTAAMTTCVHHACMHAPLRMATPSL